MPEWTGKSASFVLRFTIDDTKMLGTITEVATFGFTAEELIAAAERNEDVTLAAKVEGTFTGRIVHFRKTYIGSGGVTHSVEYEGVADAEGVVRGIWRISDLIGRFELRRGV